MHTWWTLWISSMNFFYTTAKSPTEGIGELSTPYCHIKCLGAVHSSFTWFDLINYLINKPFLPMLCHHLIISLKLLPPHHEVALGGVRREGYTPPKSLNYFRFLLWWGGLHHSDPATQHKVSLIDHVSIKKELNHHRRLNPINRFR